MRGLTRKINITHSFLIKCERVGKPVRFIAY
jgi:hypothetical protein